MIAARSLSCCGPSLSDGRVHNSGGYSQTGLVSRSGGSQVRGAAADHRGRVVTHKAGVECRR